MSQQHKYVVRMEENMEKIKNLKVNEEAFKKGKKILQKVIATGAIILTVSSPMVAYASVPSSDILGEAQITEDRSEIKKQDAADLDSYFEVSNGTVTADKVWQALEISNTMSTYCSFDVDYINTTKSEITSLDIEGLYADLCRAKSTNNEQDIIDFCTRNKHLQSALNAYILFGNKTVDESLRQNLAQRVANIYGTDTELLTSTIISDSETYVVIKKDGEVKKVCLAGKVIEEVRNINSRANYHYDTAINNIDGSSDYYENSFAYNGVSKTTNESVYLSMTNTDINEETSSALDTYYLLSTAEVYETADYSSTKENLTREEKEELNNIGISLTDLKNSSKETMTFVKAKKLVK